MILKSLLNDGEIKELVQYAVQHKLKLFLGLLVIIALVFGGSFGAAYYLNQSDRVVKNYVLALQQRNYGKAYGYLWKDGSPLSSKESFERQMQFWDYNSELDKESFLAGLKGDLQSLTVEEFSPVEQPEKAEPYSLAELLQQQAERKKLTGTKPTWKFFAVTAVVSSAEGKEEKLQTTLAVEKGGKLLDRLLGKNIVIDPCISRTVLLEVEDNTKVTLGGVELTQYQQTNYHTLIYRVEQLFPGRYPVVLENPQADSYEGNLRLSAFAKVSSRFNLQGRLQLRRQTDEIFAAEERSKKEGFTKRTAYVKGYDVFMKDRPSTGGQIVAVLQHGEALTLLDEKQCEDKQAAMVTADVTVAYNGEELKLEKGQPVKIMDEQEDSYLCRLDLEGSSGFVTIPKERLQSLAGTSWYFVQLAGGRQGWIYSELVN